MDSLLSFPPEVLINILTFLPIQSLLNFSQTNRYSHSLANYSLHTLSLAIHTSRVASSISCLSATQYPQPKHAASFFSSANSQYLPSTKLLNACRDLKPIAQGQADDQDPYHVSVLIPEAQAFDTMTLLAFHTALTSNILFRHGQTLRNLELSLWTLTALVAKAISSLSALRSLSIRIEDFPRAMPRRLVTTQRAEERKAWDILTSTATWAPRLHALRIEGGELTTAQLSTLLRTSRWCRELWLCKCSSIGQELWTFLADETRVGCAALRILGVMRCGGQLDEEVLHMIGRLRDLQFLSLLGCHGFDSEVIEKRNKEDWGIPECIPPVRRTVIDEADTVIEVDPLYMQSGDY